MNIKIWMKKKNVYGKALVKKDYSTPIAHCLITRKVLMQAWTGINWQRCRALHAIFACLASGIWWILLSLGQILLGMWYKKLINKGICLTHINYDLISLNTIFHLSKSWTRMRDFSVFFTLCVHIFCPLYSIYQYSFSSC